MAVARKGVVVLMLAFAILVMAQTGKSLAFGDCYDECVDTCIKEYGRNLYICKVFVCPVGCTLTPDQHVEEAKIIDLIKNAPPIPDSTSPPPEA